MNLKNKLIEYQLFPRQYFSGSDVYIMIGNTIVDEIISIQFEMSQEVSLLYGYASYTADAVAYGARAVNGTLAINFRKSGYLMSILDQASPSLSPTEEVYEDEKNIPYIGGSSHIADLVRNNDRDKLQDVMNHQEKLIWGVEKRRDRKDSYYEPTLLPTNNNLKTRLEGFDIVISYGDKGFHIGDSIGEIPSTVDVINGVHLVSCKKLIEPSGENILEEYAFVAKDFNNKIGSKKLGLHGVEGLAKSKSPSNVTRTDIKPQTYQNMVNNEENRSPIEKYRYSKDGKTIVMME